MDKSRALKLLQDSRERIDSIDEELLSLISKRTALSRDIIKAKIILDIDIHDPKREEHIQKKAKNIARKNNIDEEGLRQIMKILTDLNKKEQEEILRRKYNGKY